ncbi:uncharacterized protein METZ01_LOCUS132946 [marine metagenome]|uniref:Uncharacterized protein n=1 Tax=marine metagenome TaxID=408172 RepID=A0A381YTZ9_9ZZZZ
MFSGKIPPAISLPHFVIPSGDYPKISSPV